MADKLAICNGALIRLGAEPVTAFTDGTKGIKACNQRFEECKRTLLRRHPWNFAIKRFLIDDPDVEAPVFGYAYSFSLPADFLRVVEVCENNDYTIEGRKLLTNDAVGYLRYIWDVDNPTMYDSTFAEALTAYLAWDICYYLTQSNELKQVLWEEFKEVFKKAKTPDAQEQPTQELGADLYLEARLTGTSSAEPKRNWPS